MCISSPPWTHTFLPREWRGYMNNPPLATRIDWDLSEQESTDKNGIAHPVRCNETGYVYSSVREVSTVMQLDRRSVAQHLAGRRNSVGGYTFSRIAPPENRSREVVIMADSLSRNELRAIQSIVASAKTDDPDKKLEHLGEAAWFIKQETDLVLTQEIAATTNPLKGTHHVSS
jgi:hypothetical protein